ncbi:MAG: biotin transporter BioY [Dongiaceae bacterium]
MTTASTVHSTLIGALWPSRDPAVLRWILLMAAGSLFIAACAQIAVPLQPVPITMQTFAILTIGAAYGWRLGAATVAAYLLEGAIGLPVFAEFKSGLPVLFGPTGGYLFGFVVAAAMVGWLAEQGWDRNILKTAIAMLAGNALIYVPGLVVLAAFVGGDKVLESGLTPFLVGDALKLVLAACLLPLAWRIIGHGRPKI